MTGTKHTNEPTSYETVFAKIQSNLSRTASRLRRKCEMWRANGRNKTYMQCAYGNCTSQNRRICLRLFIFNLFASKLDLNLRKRLVRCYVWSKALYGAETWTLRATDQKHLESFEMWCWRRMEKISSTDHVRNDEGLL